jgi:hypothetical protein
MFHRRHMPIYLLAVWLAVDLAVYGWLEIVSLRRYFVILPLLLWGQFAAVSGWLVLGDRGGRAYLAALVAAPWVVALWAGSQRGLFSFLASLVSGYVVLTIYGGFLSVPLLIARGDGLRLRFEPGPNPGLPFYQFRIREIMFYTVLVALVAATWSAARAIPAAQEPWRNSSTWGEEVWSLGLISLLVPWTVWTVFIWARVVHGAVVALLATAFWAAVVYPQHRIGALLIFLQTAPLILHLLALQLAGFRFERRWPESPQHLENGPDNETVERWKMLATPEATR